MSEAPVQPVTPVEPVQPTPPAAPPATPEGGAFAAVVAGDPPPQVPLAERIPEKYRVVKEGGEFDIEASTGKLAEAYANLEKKLGAGDVPPKTPEEYAPQVEGFDMEELKADPKFQGFLKGAHAKGLTNAQVEFVLSEYAARAGEDATVQSFGMSTPDFQAAVSEEFTREYGGYVQGMQSGLRAIRAYAPDATAADIASIPNNPLVSRVLAAIGKEIPEDRAPGNRAIAAADWESEVSAIRASDAYNNPAHPEHKKTKDRMDELYRIRYPQKA